MEQSKETKNMALFPPSRAAPGPGLKVLQMFTTVDEGKKEAVWKIGNWKIAIGKRKKKRTKNHQNKMKDRT